MGNHGGPYAAICMEFDILLKICVSSNPSEYTIEIPSTCELVEFKISGK